MSKPFRWLLIRWVVLSAAAGLLMPIAISTGKWWLMFALPLASLHGLALSWADGPRAQHFPLRRKRPATVTLENVPVEWAELRVRQFDDLARLRDLGDAVNESCHAAIEALKGEA